MSDESDHGAKIKRMSTRYVPEQDRLRIAAEMDDGEVHVLWLTQRLLRLSLVPLAGFFEKTKPPSAEQVARRSYVELIQKVSGKSGPPVATIEPSAEWLIEGLDIKFRSPAIVFLFKGEGGRKSFMEMDSLKLRKWLAILHRKSQKNGWLDPLWPKGVLDAME